MGVTLGWLGGVVKRTVTGRRVATAEESRSRAETRRKRRIQELFKDMDVRRLEIDVWERESLVPMLKDRVGRMLELFQRLVGIAKEPGLAAVLTPTYATLLPGQPSLPTARKALDTFLLELRQSIEESYIAPLGRLLEQYRQVESLGQLRAFLNEVRFLCTAITGTEGRLFRYRIITHLQVTREDTGEVIKDEPKELSVILMPFKPAIDELRLIAQSTEDSIEHWRRQQEEMKKPFLEYLTAYEARRTTQLNSWLQWAAVALAFVLSLLFLGVDDLWDLRQENKRLETKIAEAQSERAVLQEQLRNANENNKSKALELGRLRIQLEELRPGVKAPAAPSVESGSSRAR